MGFNSGFKGLTLSLSTALSLELCHIRSLNPSGNLDSSFLLQFFLPYFIEDYPNTELHQLCRPRNFWAYLSAHDWAHVLKYYQILVEGFSVFLHSSWVVLWIFRRVHKIAKKRILDASCMSVCPYGLTLLLLEGFSWNFIFEYFSKNCQENWSFIKVGQK